MPQKSKYNYKEVKDIVFKTVKKIVDTPITFRESQYQSLLVFLPSEVNNKTIEKKLFDLETGWHFTVIANNYLLNLTRKEKLNEKTN